ncbi:hypothetical protein OAory_01076060 [Aspergillus oryzae]|uniref:Uncharacterized protein n=1 Tax=Aspergillus oryzae TaxID=5062 RepID=A0A1S9DQJ1_ASPOZ|nr:hypothetical protein OAory_01076060 [Aspergillus oryzae]
MSSASKENLHGAMKGGETTDKWDVLVSYDQGKLQKYLKAAWAKTHRVASAEFKVTTMIAGHEFEEDFKLTIEDPTLEFYQGSNEARARLTMDISGTSTSKQFPNEPLTIDRGNFSLQVTLPVKAIHGDGGSTIAKEDVLHFEDEKVSSFHITFHFANDENDWKIIDKKPTNGGDPGSKNKQKEALQSARTKIENHFHDLSDDELISLSIVEVSNDKHKGASDLLTPKSFSLASQDGVLNVFINTKGSGRGPGADTRQFQLKRGVHYTPIPSGFGASIVISRYILVEKFLLAEIRKSASAAHLTGSDGVQEKGGVGSGDDKTGALFEMKYSKSLTTAAEWHNYRSIQLDSEGLSIDFDKYPLHLEIKDDSSLKTKYSWQWNCKGTLDYNEIISTPCGGHVQPFHAKFDVSIKDNSTELATLHDDMISWNIKFGKENQPDGTKGDQNIQANLKLYEYDLKLPDLDYFRTTNIFAPGKHMIDAKDMMFPYDLIILGDLAGP